MELESTCSKVSEESEAFEEWLGEVEETRPSIRIAGGSQEIGFGGGLPQHHTNAAQRSLGCQEVVGRPKGLLPRCTWCTPDWFHPQQCSLSEDPYSSSENLEKLSFDLSVVSRRLLLTVAASCEHSSLVPKQAATFFRECACV